MRRVDLEISSFSSFKNSSGTARVTFIGVYKRFKGLGIVFIQQKNNGISLS
jgi:hypothetical protein